MLVHQLKLKKINELLQSLGGIAEARPKECSWDLAKNIRVLKAISDSVQDQVAELRKEYVDKDKDGNPIEVDGKGEFAGKKVTEITDPKKRAEFSAIVDQANNDTYEVKLHRILKSAIQPEIESGKINPVDVSFCLGYIFVSNETEKSKSGVAKPEDLFENDDEKFTLPVIGSRKEKVVLEIKK